MKNPYRVLGIGLAFGGALFAPVAYFLAASIPLTAVGLSAVMIGFTCVALANSRPVISPESAELILKTGMENTAALLEELGLNTRAIYLPSAMRDGKPQAVIPLVDTVNSQLLKGKVTGRLIVRYGDNPDDMGIAVTTPGSINLQDLPAKPGPAAEEIESALSYVLTGLLDIADSAMVRFSGERVEVEVRGARMHYENIWYYRCLGSPVASIAATIICEALNQPVRILEETYNRGKSKIVLEVIR